MVSQAFRLDGKTALVAGDSRYWTRYAAAALAEAGANVAVMARKPERLEAAAEAVRQQGGRVLAIPGDTVKAADVATAAEKAVAEFGRIDILVNTTECQFARPFLETTEAEWRRVLDVHLMSAFNTCQVVGRRMVEQKKGRIINILSCLAERGVENFAAYCVAMGGVLQLTRALDIEWARHGVTTNAIGVGWMSEEERTGAPQEEFLLKYLPLKRYGHPREMGSLLVYLASDTTDFFSGQFLYVDGAVMSHL